MTIEFLLEKLNRGRAKASNDEVVGHQSDDNRTCDDNR
jgi:hypothetical protein